MDDSQTFFGTPDARAQAGGRWSSFYADCYHEVLLDIQLRSCHAYLQSVLRASAQYSAFAVQVSPLESGHRVALVFTLVYKAVGSSLAIAQPPDEAIIRGISDAMRCAPACLRPSRAMRSQHVLRFVLHGMHSQLSHPTFIPKRHHTLLKDTVLLRRPSQSIDDVTLTNTEHFLQVIRRRDR